MPNLQNHPLVADRLARLRSTNCPPQEFRQHVSDIARLMVLPATANLATNDTEVTTPLTSMTGQALARPIVLVPILRAGLGISEAFLQMLPEASVAHYGMARNEDTLQPEVYLERIPDHIEEAEVFILDPMLATGGSAIAAIDGLKKRGARHLHFVCLVASPEGIKLLEESHPDVPVTTAAIDQGLNENGYIVPGLGDAGDRIFGTL
ncbi:uracil phosphoribosyltransferase [Akkermansiaceae bacterium]|jgi:uracil phosphoribosyltransferase|nr:uracil phosphoribosyltransferase [bacterium]MDA7933694.1 uracil phosphoribosyltransferase [Akkermansiaceae bacterium]MDB4383178.1 uracil phosphoribosyltransferase [Akkermansiaceae bacterium]MDB4509554.1 uracil phosphoribosyltransferase [Akkermansiaceae bacterium]MDB4680369.1 uracil phosphoribosyltransferase [Akkermansiaceae bacterium]